MIAIEAIKMGRISAGEIISYFRMTRGPPHNRKSMKKEKEREREKE